jgi:hypothetical protein
LTSGRASGYDLRVTFQYYLALPTPMSTGEPSNPRAWPTVLVTRDHAYGSPAQVSYDPLRDAYELWRGTRESGLPPHLVFANLRETPEALRAFLQSYGPITPKLGAASKADINKVVSTTSPAEFRASEYWSQVYKLVPISPPVSVASGEWLTFKVENFWAEQNYFAALVKLWAAIRNNALNETLKKLFWGVKKTGEQVRLGYRNEWFGGHPNPERWNKRDVIWAASERIAAELQHRLADVHPGVNVTSNLKRPPSLMSAWEVSSLLEALYLMFYLDVTQARRLVRCENCDLIFADPDSRVRFCSSRCETTHRVRLWREQQRSPDQPLSKKKQ